MKKQMLDLNGTWHLQQTKATEPISVAAEVPGVVHLDLLRAGKIPDPFYRLNEKQVQWIENETWQYSRTFSLSQDWLDQFADIELVCEGLDTFATLSLNGRQVGETNNMFHPWRFGVKKFLIAGENQLVIQFQSAANTARKLAAPSDVALQAYGFRERVYMRQAQYASGWDWGPRLITTGIWRPIYLVGIPEALIRHVGLFSQFTATQSAQITWEIELEVTAAGEFTLEFEIANTRQTVHKQERQILATGQHSLSFEMELHQPDLWWPVGLGEAALYQVSLQVKTENTLCDAWGSRYGIRQVKLLREADNAGESFIFEINGQKVFCKGADWIPADSFLPRVTRERYSELLTEAVQANMNMLRVWGGGIYEQPDFYQLCDELGLMIWQDFMFACGEYPEETSFWNVIEKEATEVLLRLRNHPCIVLWCGNNENHWQYQNIHPDTGIFYGQTIYEKLLPQVCSRLDPSRPYWPGSPYGGPAPNHPGFGNYHAWEVWSGWEPAESYRKHQPRFVSEFGFQSAPSWRAVQQFTEAADRFLFSEVLDWHNKQVSGNQRLYRFLLEQFQATKSLPEFIYLTQIIHAEALKIGVEHWRQAKFHTAGALFWQLNDCWPVSSWACLDYYSERKAAWYFARKFFAPILVSFKPVDNHLEIWGVNDTTQALHPKLTLLLLSFTGKIVTEIVETVTLPANSARRLWQLPASEVDRLNPCADFVLASLEVDGEAVSENSHFFLPMKFLHLPQPDIALAVTESEKGYLITLRSAVLAKYVQLTCEAPAGKFSDNFFDLFPGVPREIRWCPTLTKPTQENFLKQLSCHYFLPTGWCQVKIAE